MRTVVTRACVLDGARWPEEQHIVVEQGRIEALLPASTPVPEADRTLDARGALAMPGFFNAHAHNHELYLKGRLCGMPLEPYILSVSAGSPSRRGLSPEDLYYRALASCGEMLRNGITGVADDVIHPSLAREDVEAVLTAYRDSGMRARVSMMVEDSPWRRSVPYSGSDAHTERLDLVKDDPAEALSAYRGLLEAWGGAGRVGLMVSPSAPQRCSPAFLHELVELARSQALPFHIHIQETLAQRVAGPKLFDGRSMVGFMAEEGLLGQETTIAHAIWIDDADIARIADAGATVVHNPVSNLKLGSGVARVRDLLDAGINVSLGTDGLTCNDALDLFEASKCAATLSCIASPDPSDWLKPREVLAMASVAGATANGYSDVGRIAVGQRADFVLIDPASYGLIPRNDAASQVVFSVRARDVTHVFVDGALVVEDGECTTMDVRRVNAKVAAAAEEFWAEAEGDMAENLGLLPGVELAYREAVAELGPTGLCRLIAPLPPEWRNGGASPERSKQRGG